jgi:hypothetical protein
VNLYKLPKLGIPPIGNVSQKGTAISYQFIKAHESEFEVQIMCEALGVSRSGYDDWRQRGATTAQERRDAAVGRHIQTIFETRQGTDGRPRVYAQLKT